MPNCESVNRSPVCDGSHSRHCETRGWVGSAHPDQHGSGSCADDRRQQQDGTSHCCTGMDVLWMKITNWRWATYELIVIVEWMGGIVQGCTSHILLLCHNLLTVRFSRFCLPDWPVRSRGFTSHTTTKMASHQIIFHIRLVTHISCFFCLFQESIYVVGSVCCLWTGNV